MAKELDDTKKEKSKLEETINDEAVKREVESQSFKDLEEKVQT